MWESQGTLALPHPGPCHRHMPCRRFSCSSPLHYTITVCLHASWHELPCAIGMPRGEGAACCHRPVRSTKAANRACFWNVERTIRWRKPKGLEDATLTRSIQNGCEGPCQCMRLENIAILGMDLPVSIAQQLWRSPLPCPSPGVVAQRQS